MTETTGTPTRLDGAWELSSYVVKGQAHAVQGVLLLTAGHWATVYFVPGEAGPWGSAESGLFDTDGDRLTFRHRQTFQGGGGRELTIEQAASRVEVCGVRLEGNALRIQFPSGNILNLRRARVRTGESPPAAAGR